MENLNESHGHRGVLNPDNKSANPVSLAIPGVARPDILVSRNAVPERVGDTVPGVDGEQFIVFPNEARLQAQNSMTGGQHHESIVFTNGTAQNIDDSLSGIGGQSSIVWSDETCSHRVYSSPGGHGHASFGLTNGNTPNIDDSLSGIGGQSSIVSSNGIPMDASDSVSTVDAQMVIVANDELSGAGAATPQLGNALTPYKRCAKCDQQWGLHLFRKANKTCNMCLARDKGYHDAGNQRRLLEAAKAGARALLDMFPNGLPVGLAGDALSDAIAAAGMAAMAAAPAVTHSPAAAAAPGITDDGVGFQVSVGEQPSTVVGSGPLTLEDLNPVARGGRHI